MLLLKERDRKISFLLIPFYLSSSGHVLPRVESASFILLHVNVQQTTGVWVVCIVADLPKLGVAIELRSLLYIHLCTLRRKQLEMN